MNLLCYFFFLLQRETWVQWCIYLHGYHWSAFHRGLGLLDILIPGPSVGIYKPSPQYHWHEDLKCLADPEVDF